MQICCWRDSIELVTFWLIRDSRERTANLVLDSSHCPVVWFCRRDFEIDVVILLLGISFSCWNLWSDVRADMCVYSRNRQQKHS